MNALKFLAAAAVSGVVLSGCTTVNTVEPAQPVAQRQMLSSKQVVTDGSLNSRVRVLGVNTATGPAGFLKIQVEVQNVTSRVQSFTYRIEWFDESGIVINLPTAGSTARTLEGKETGFITATAPTERAKDFRIKFLEPTN